MPAADRDPDGRMELTYQQAAELYARAEQRAALLRAAVAPNPPFTRRRRLPVWKLALPSAAVALAAGVLVWAQAGGPAAAGPASLDAFTMGPTIARPQASVGRSGPVYALAPTLGFQVLLPHTTLANPRLLSGAWAGQMATGDDSGPSINGIVLEFPSTGLRVTEFPWTASAGSTLRHTGRVPGGYTVRSAIRGTLLVRIVGVSGWYTQRQLETVLRSLR